MSKILNNFFYLAFSILVNFEHLSKYILIFSDDPWTTDHENRLREHMSRLKAERSNIQGTYVTLESTQVEAVPVRPSTSQEARKLDLEMAVLMQVINY